MNTDHLEATINAAWELRHSPQLPEGTHACVHQVLDELSAGNLRVATRHGGEWTTHDWIKKAVLLYFLITPMEESHAGPLQFCDKVPLQGGWRARGVRVVPPAAIRYGAHVATGCVIMPSYVNIGAFVGAGTMVDTWATIGTCAQIGERCHISGGVGIGGVLEPLQADPVIIEDNVFIGARSEVAEGVHVGEGAVLAMGCYVGASTPIFNAMNGARTNGHIPPRAVVVPGTLPSRDGSHHSYTLIIKKFRDEKTDARTALNDLLR